MATAPNQRPWDDLERKCNLVLGALEERERVAAILGPTGPVLSTTDLHPEVWSASATFFDHGVFKESVPNASRAVNVMLQDKLIRRDLGEAKLVQQAWSTNAPEPDRPRQRYPGVDEGDQPAAWKDLNVGTSQFGSGLFTRVRNVLEHVVRGDVRPVGMLGRNLLDVVLGHARRDGDASAYRALCASCD